MFLNNKEEIIDWFLLNKTFRNKYEFYQDIYFTKENNQLIVNTNSFIYLSLNKDIKELPIKFGTINGSFNLYNSNLENFVGFPNVINGSFECHGNNFKSTKGWEIKEIKGNINLCGQNCELDNLLFLENTIFQEFILKITNTPFKENINDKSLEKYNDSLMYDDFKEYIKEYKKEKIEFDNYLESFDKKLSIKDL